MLNLCSKASIISVFCFYLLRCVYLLIPRNLTVKYARSEDVFFRDKSSIWMNSSELCTPKTANRLNEFMKVQWNLARQELMLKTFDFELKPFLFSRFVERFNKFSAGLCIFHLNNTIISYARIYKCANEAIVQNLNAFSRNEGALKWHTFLTLNRKSEVDLFKENLNKHDVGSYKIFKYRPLQYDLIPTYQFPTFTFVRDPFFRFESGLAEAGNDIWCTCMRHILLKYIIKIPYLPYFSSITISHLQTLVYHD